MKRLRGLGKRKLTTILVASLVLVLVGLYLSRGLIRGPIASSVATHLYAHRIDAVFADKVVPINAELQKIGITPLAQGSIENGKAECSGGNFLFIHETILCGKWLSSDYVPLRDVKLSSWSTDSRQIEKTLSEKGWKLDPAYGGPSQNAPPDKLFNTLDKFTQSAYFIDVGKVRCTLQLTYSPAFGSADTFRSDTATLQAYEFCGRTVRVFGGFREG